MKNFYTLILVLPTVLFTRAQVDTACGIHHLSDSLDITTLPWYGNNQFLYDFSDSIDMVYGTFSPESGEDYEGGFNEDTVYFWIPVKAWVYHDDNGQGGISESEVRKSIRNLNRRFSGKFNPDQQANGHTNIQFYLKCDITYINSTGMALFAHIFYSNYWENNYDERVINIHYVQDANDWSGVGRYPWSSNNPYSTAIKTNNFSHLNSSLAHEIGHNLGLYHTHHYSSKDDPNNPSQKEHDENRNATPCFQESVSRSRLQGSGCHQFGQHKCEVTGDILCDTEADPGLSNKVNNNNMYYGGGTDHWNDAWTPNVFNIMSYAPRNIMQFFSEEQKIVMKYTTTGGGVSAWLKIHHENNLIDVYEPDDIPSEASEIQFGIPQLRGLHAIPSGLLTAPILDFCNEDWVKFTLTSSKVVGIRTKPVDGKPAVDTKIYLFEKISGTNNLVFLESNDDITFNDKYSVILDKSLSAGEYYILIENAGNTPGAYMLSLEDCGSDECCFQPLLSKITEIHPWGVSTSVFNIGHHNNPIERIHKDIKIWGGATLGCNISALIGRGVSGDPAPIPNSHLEIVICDDAEIDVIEGNFIIGDPSNNLSATVTLTSGSALKLKSQGKLVINNNSKLIVEDDASLEVLQGAEIELVGSNSILEIKGKVIVGDNATFGFSGGGRIVFDQFIYPGVFDNFWDIGQNAKIDIEGYSHHQHVLLECKGNFSPKMENHHTFENIRIVSGKILLHPGVHMSITSPLNFRHMEVTVPSGNEADISNWHGGLRLWGVGYGQTHLYNNRFFYGSFGIRSTQVSANHPLRINTSKFENVLSGIHIDGKNFEVYDCEFADNHLEAIYANNLHGASIIANSEFAGSPYGIALQGQTGAETTVSNCSFTDNSTTLYLVDPIGIYVKEHNLKAQCNVFEGLGYGIYAHFDSYVDLLGEGKNNFLANKYGLYMRSVDGFDMAGGNNNFNNSFVDVYLHSNNGTNIPLVGAYEVDLSGNTMRYCPSGTCQERGIFGTVPNQNNGWYNQLSVGPQKLTYNPDYTQTFNNCSGGAPSNNYISEYDLAGKVVSGLSVTVGGNNANVIDATLEAAQRITSSNGNDEADDQLALEQLDEITGQLLDEFSTLTNDEKRLININIRMMQKALGQLYAQHILAYNNGEENPPHSEVESLNDMIELLKSKYPTPVDTADYERNAMLDLERVFAYRQGGFYATTQDILAVYPNYVSPRIFDKWSYWDCVCNAENNYFTGQIEPEQFAEDILFCHTQFAPRILDEMDAEQPEVADKDPEFILNVYPNPTGDFFYFRAEHLAEPEEIVRKEMFNLLGVKVYSEEAEASFIQRVDVRNLPSGSYLLEVTGGGKTYQKKVIIN